MIIKVIMEPYHAQLKSGRPLMLSAGRLACVFPAKTQHDIAHGRADCGGVGVGPLQPA